MSNANINRLHNTSSIAIAAAATSGGPIDIRGWAGGQIHFPTTWVGGTATFRCAPTAGGTYQEVRALSPAKSAQQLTGTLSARVFDVPAPVMAGGHFLKVHRAVASAAAGTKTLRFTFKG